MSTLSQEQGGYDPRQVRTWEIGAGLYVRRGKDGYIPLGERAWLEEIDQHQGLTPEVVERTRNRSGNTLTALLSQSGDDDMVKKLEHVVGNQPFEVFRGRLLSYYKGKGSSQIYEYANELSQTHNPNISSAKKMPLLFYICYSFLQETRSPYITLMLLEDFLKLPGVNVNVCNMDGEYIFDIFDTEDDLHRYNPLVQCLYDYGADPALSEKWMFDEQSRLIRRPQIASKPIEESVTESPVPEAFVSGRSVEPPTVDESVKTTREGFLSRATRALAIGLYNEVELLFPKNKSTK